nr:XRE family transcriptional regulator [Fredinandcohnia onubensis]
MKIGRAKGALKEARHEVKLTQLQLSFDTYDSRENISHMENGRHKVQPNISSYFANEHNNPWVAMEAAAEYINWGPSKLDGEAADLHRTSVLLKTREELEEAIKALDIAAKRLSVMPKQLQEHDLQIIEKSIDESIDVITASNHYVAVLCKEYGLSWMRMWTKHKLKLVQRRFLKK